MLASFHCFSLAQREIERLPRAEDKQKTRVARYELTKDYKQDIMKIKLTSVMVEDQDRALKFYTEVLGFVKKTEFPVGDFKWLTVVSPDGPEDIELALEPNANPAAKTFQKAMFEQGIPLTSFAVEDIQEEYQRMIKMGVIFRTKPTRTGPVTIAVFDDTCGNMIQLYQG
jgi:catechol 2,3-dioxygenase-like lactoylglutathione lyase family enzyme